MYGLFQNRTPLQMILDFALLGEKGRNGNFGMSAKELKQRFTKPHNEQDVLLERINEYTTSKISLMIDMIKRAIGKDSYHNKYQSSAHGYD